jgi:hypothetical protein
MQWSRGIAAHMRTSALDAGKKTESRRGRFTPGESGPDTHWVWRWMCPRRSLDAVEKSKLPYHQQEPTPICQSLNPQSRHSYRLMYPVSGKGERHLKEVNPSVYKRK